MNKRSDLLAIIESEPEISGAELARRLGLTRQRITQIMQTEGLTLFKRAKPAKAPKPEWSTLNMAAAMKRVPLNKCGGGAMAELLVAIDLLGRNLDVFRSVSTTARSDLVACYRSAPYTAIRIQVKSGQPSKSNPDKIHYQKPEFPDAHDLVAVPCKDGRIFYYPDDKILTNPLDKVVSIDDIDSCQEGDTNDHPSHQSPDPSTQS